MSTSCTECRRRKQKCDQQQPCRQCARRYPQPECIYGNVKTPTDKREHPFTTVIATPIVRKPALESVGVKDVTEAEGATISIATLHQFDTAECYQQILNSMVSQLQYHTLSNHQVDQDTANSNSSAKFSWEDGSDNSKIQWQLQKSRRRKGSVSPHDMAISSVDPLHFLGITPTTQNARLLHAFVNTITKYVFSIDGKPGPNHYNDVWIPWAMKSPLLAYLGIFSSACYLAEAQRSSPEKAALALGYKTKSLHLLNEMLSDPRLATSNEAIGAVLNITITEWHWNNHEIVKQHMEGLVQIIKLKGGLDELGPGHCLREMILTTDYCLCVTYDWEPLFEHLVKNPSEYPVHISIPFIAATSSFVKITSQLEIGKETAIILDDMRFLFNATMNRLDGDVSELEKSKIASTSTWIQQRISDMPDGSQDPLLDQDFIYKSCRIAALVYCNAIVSRIPLSKACSLTDLSQLWAIMWQVKLSRWKEIPGIFLFIMLATAPAAQHMPHGRFLKIMMKATALSMTLDSWEVVDKSMYTYVNLQRWLRRSSMVDLGSSPPQALEFLHFY